MRSQLSCLLVFIFLFWPCTSKPAACQYDFYDYVKLMQIENKEVTTLKGVMVSSIEVKDWYMNSTTLKENYENKYEYPTKLRSIHFEKFQIPQSVIALNCGNIECVPDPWFLYKVQPRTSLITLAFRPNFRNSKVLILGLGAGTLPVLYQKFTAHVDAVEYDSKVVQTAKDYFGVTTMDNVNVYAQSAESFLEKTAPNTYDFILVDIPFPSITLQRSLAKALTPKGVVWFSIWGYDAATKMSDSKAHFFSQHFKEVHDLRLEKALPNNLLIIATQIKTSFNGIEDVGKVIKNIDIPLKCPLSDVLNMVTSWKVIRTERENWIK